MQRYDEFGGVPVDPLTSLYRLGAGGPNLTTALAAASATHRRVALLHIDVDDFGAINRNMGETVADQALSAIAQRLHKAMPPGGWLWRVGGDQFLAGIGYRQNEPDAAALAERLRAVAEVTEVVVEEEGEVCALRVRSQVDVREALATAVLERAQLRELRPAAQGLEEVFMRLTTRSAS